jgi:lambda family phage portal protein
VNRLDRAIAAVAPRAALRRELARVQLRQVERIGSRAQTRRRPDEWRINDPATRRWEARQGKPMNRYDREMLRHVFETNPFAVKVKGSLLNNLIGYGITGTVKGTKAVQSAWTDWIEVCDYDGVCDLYGLQELIANIWLDDGEAFVVTRIVPGAAVHPLRLQVFDADQLDTAAAQAGVRMRDGIEYGTDGRPAFYHFKRSREIEAYGDPIRVPADQVIHLFHRKRAGQWRGRPLFESVLDVVGDIDDYLEAEGVRKKISACFVGFRAPSLEGDDPAMGRINPDGTPLESADEPPEESFYPGMIINGRPGEQMTFGDPKVDAGIDDYMRWGGLRMAAGAQTTYERATGDLSKVNYSSYRAGDLEFQRFVGRIQWLLIIPKLLRRIERAFVEAGYVTGLIGQRAPMFKWTPPPFGSVDPGKDIKAKREQVAAGVESLRNLAAELGYDLDDLSDEIVADLAMLKKKFEDAGMEALVPQLLASLLGLNANTGGGQNAPVTEPAA